jgi:hypothetical protein
MVSIAIFAQALQIRIGWRLNPASIFASSGPVSCSILLQNEQCKFIGMLGSIAFCRIERIGRWTTGGGSVAWRRVRKSSGCKGNEKFG